MKKYILLFALLFLLPLPALAEQIDNYQVTIIPKQDSTVLVTEKIEYNFGDLERHGIYRDIITEGIKISGIKVKDENNRNYHFTTSRTGEKMQIKIGDADKLITGQHTYIISYTVKNAFNFFADHDELYWNAIGSAWNVPISLATTGVVVPEEVGTKEVSQACYQGKYGDNLACSKTEFLNKEFVFTSQNLSPYQGQTIVVGFPKGYFIEPTFWEKHWLEILSFILPVVTFLVVFYFWYTRGRDPRGRGTIITQFEAPDKLSPVETGTLLDHTLQPKDLTAEIVYLATKGYLKITHLPKKGIFGKADFILKRLKKGDDLPNEFDQALLHAFMMYSNTEEEIKLSSLENKFYKDYSLIKKVVYNSLLNKGYYKSNPVTIFITYLVLGFALVVLGLFLVDYSWFVFLAFLLSGLFVAGFAFIMPAYTEKGVLAKEHILGLKSYLTVAEKDRLEFHNAPEKNAETFEKFLPFAIALGVEKVWAKKFADIYLVNPSWYQGSFKTFNSALFVSSLSDFSSATTDIMSKASSGGSGFGGGGVGGGGGGGGGGSW